MLRIVQEVNRIIAGFKNSLIRSTFAAEKPKLNRKMSSIGFKSSDIQNSKFDISNPEIYLSKQPIVYQNGKYLFYRNRRTIFQKFIYSSPITSVIACTGYLIYVKAWKDIFPIAPQILGFFELTVLLWLAKRSLWNQRIVREMYLLEGGESTQIIFENQFKRKLFHQSLSETYYNSIFVSPSEQNPFCSILPNDFANSNEQRPIFFLECWTKYVSNDQNYLLIPGKPDFINKVIFGQVMKGMVIKQ